MNRKQLFLCILAMSPALSQAIAGGDPGPDLLLKLIRDNGCQMTGEQANEILPQHGFTKEQTQQIARDWAAKGIVDTTRIGVIALSRKACKG